MKRALAGEYAPIRSERRKKGHSSQATFRKERAKKTQNERRKREIASFDRPCKERGGESSEGENARKGRKDEINAKGERFRMPG